MRRLCCCLFVLAVPCEVRADAQPIQVPYRRTDTQHILVRLKIDGQGPFNFIIDTGAPAMFVAKSVAAKIGLEAKDGWAVIKRLDIEGGVRLDDVKVRVETPFQLEGMNGMNLAGAELHGIIGYMVLAKFRMDIDLTKHKMIWTPLDFQPPPPKGLGKGVGGQGGLELIGTVMKLLGFLSGRNDPPPPAARGFIGVELDDKDQKLTVRKVLAQGPADQAGLKAGDRLLAINGSRVSALADAARLTARARPGQELRVTIRRGTDEKILTIDVGDGL